MAHTPLSHTADTGIEATAPSLADLIAELAGGMFQLMAMVEPCPEVIEVETTIEADTDEDLVVDTLSELLYLAEIEDRIYCRFQVREEGERSVVILAAGVSIRDVELTGPSIKAVTYHDLVLEQRGDGWYARVYFDV